jgi:ComF family protein
MRENKSFRGLAFSTRAANAVLSVVLAPVCAVCETLLDQPLGGCVCGPCWKTVRPITPPVCDRCGDPLARDQTICSSCRQRPPAVDRARAVGEYQGTLRDIIHAFKYAGRRSLARPLASLMRMRGTALLSHADGVIPVPLHWRREYQRGFNQAQLLAAHLELPIINALVRRRHTRPQVELAASQRHENVADAFELRGTQMRRRLIGMKVVLIDDVSTTGATMDACARVLREAGTAEISALTAARVITHRALPGRSGVMWGGLEDKSRQTRPTYEPAAS